MADETPKLTKEQFNSLIALHNRRCDHDVIGIPYDELLALRAAIDALRPQVGDLTQEAKP